MEQAFASGTVPVKARPAVQNLVLTTGRHLALLDAVLDSFLVRGGMQTLPVTARSGLRLGAAETLFGDAPVYACVSSWVEEIKLLAGPKFAGVANAVLRKVAGLGEAAQAITPADAVTRLPEASALVASAHGLACGDGAWLAALTGASDAHLAVVASHPEWLVADWRARFGGQAFEMLSAAQRPHRQALRWDWRELKRKLSSAEADLALHLEKQASLVEFEGEEYALMPTGAAQIVRSAFDAGLVSLQGVASQAVIRRFPPPAEELTLDACAGVGVKSVLIALLAGGPERLVATDIVADKLNELAENFERIGLPAPRCFACDITDSEVAAELRNAFPAGFARIYIDAPCSGTGTLGRLPFKRYGLSERTAKEMAAKQQALIAACRTLLAEGGDIVYITCSLQREENEEVVGASGERGLRCEDSFWTVLPTEDYLEGMFAARLAGQ
jgi:16S rRNA C967 or C1407 C5-methylase (RsmB/RsmF family)